ncbi:MAG TPA: glutamine synthetase family protein [Geminicoccus sp.]|uniref:glutamine synthetase family protein n=1 Tax=Geminicoccus sp. TaxID=2024832 RepID=UPI002BEFD9F4|nr:glutamine synthetase family protein [Geminicoccus sp.]HWL68192.1 glutamine synthetase family protein [Geminicoccus sp.]
MNGMLTLDQLEELVASGEIDTVVVAFTDMQGRLIGKRATGQFFLDSVVKEWHACDYLLAVDMEMEPVPGFKAASWDKGYGDFVIKPDLATLRRIPWLDATALCLGDVVDHHGEPLPHSPRAILKKQLARLSQRGMMAKMASELEFYAFDDDFRTAREKRYHDVQTSGWYIEDYHIFEGTKREKLLRAIRNGIDAAGIPVQESKGEWGPGQEELNLVYAEALEMADRHVVFKNGAKEIAWQQGKAITFMAKWKKDLAGSSCHIHASLWDQEADKPLFADKDDKNGFSKLFQNYLAGLLAAGGDATLLLAPNLNSYKRFVAGSFAPTNLVWSRDNRTAGFRVLGSGGASLRVECRVPGADVNPYLAYAGLLAAGLHGVEQGLELPEAFSGDAYQSGDVPAVPSTLREATERFDRSEVMRAALGDAVVDHYVHAARWEQAEYDRAVTDWELIRYFERG